MKHKLTLKQLAPYLPYGLNIAIWDSEKVNRGNFVRIKGIKIITLNSSWISLIDRGQSSQNENYYANNERNYPYRIPIKDYQKTKYIKPILRNISMLTQEIECNGEVFIPLEKLYWISHYSPVEDFLDHIADFQEKPNEASWECCPKLVLDKLNEWHFDYQGLIDQNLALPIEQ